ncbi:MAG: hypothetical protein IJP61_04625 [Treponema sp.]|nr:hypothetical protein [Treponema sp.]
MGAIWDFIAGKSTDWEAARARDEEYRRTHPRPRHVKYKAYCRYCGVECDFSYSTPSNAIKYLQYKSSGCGCDNHTPVIQEVDS